MASQHEVQSQSDGLFGTGRAPAMANLENTGEGKCSLLVSGNGKGICDGLYDRPLSCFGCGIGWFCFILGFVFPLLWYVATVLYFGKYYLRDPRERAGLAASAIAALICSVALLITFLAYIL